MRRVAFICVLASAALVACERGPTASTPTDTGSLPYDELKTEVKAADERRRDLAARAPAWTGGCPSDYLDPPPASTDADLDRETLVSFSVTSAVERGDADAVRCALERARRDVSASLDRNDPEIVLLGAAQRLYSYAYFGQLLGIDTAKDGAAACGILDTEQRERQRYAARLTVRSAVEAGHLDAELLTAAESGVETGDYCSEEGR